MGCGTGRVSIPIGAKSKSLTGVDISSAMLERAKMKSKEENVSFVEADITAYDSKIKYDLIIAPFRVLQAIEHEERVQSFIEVIRTHLKADGLAILNIFNPNLPREKMATDWKKEGETLWSEHEMENGDILKAYYTRNEIDISNQVMHPEIIFRRFRGSQLVDEHINPICMKYYYPDEFTSLISVNGFEIVEKWGGYKKESYGDRPELVVSFKLKP